MTQEIDNRAYPYNTVVYIEATFGSQVVTGSGVMVGPNDILTAAHVIYSTVLGEPSTIKVIPAYDPSPFDAPYGTFFAHSWNYFTDFDPNGDGVLLDGDGSGSSRGGSELDLAILSLSVALGDRTAGWAWTRTSSPARCTPPAIPASTTTIPWTTPGPRPTTAPTG